MRRAEQAIRRTHRSVPRYRPMFRVEWRLVSVAEVGTGSRTRLPCLPRHGPLGGDPSGERGITSVQLACGRLFFFREGPISSGRDRGFADSPLEGAGFEPSVPLPKVW